MNTPIGLLGIIYHAYAILNTISMRANVKCPIASPFPKIWDQKYDGIPKFETWSRDLDHGQLGGSLPHEG